MEHACAVSALQVKRRPRISLLSYLTWFAHPVLRWTFSVLFSESEVVFSCYEQVLQRNVVRHLLRLFCDMGQEAFWLFVGFSAE